MIAYPDTSFLCSIYRWQVHHDTAVAYRRQMSEPLHYTSLLELEFLQSIRLQVWLHASQIKGRWNRTSDELVRGPRTETVLPLDHGNPQGRSVAEDKNRPSVA